jgi:hypothetical protein
MAVREQQGEFWQLRKMEAQLAASVPDGEQMPS